MTPIMRVVLWMQRVLVCVKGKMCGKLTGPIGDVICRDGFVEDLAGSDGPVAEVGGCSGGGRGVQESEASECA